MRGDFVCSGLNSKDQGAFPAATRGDELFRTITADQDGSAPGRCLLEGFVDALPAWWPIKST